MHFDLSTHKWLFQKSKLKSKLFFILNVLVLLCFATLRYCSIWLVVWIKMRFLEALVCAPAYLWLVTYVRTNLSCSNALIKYVLSVSLLVCYLFNKSLSIPLLLKNWYLKCWFKNLSLRGKLHKNLSDNSGFVWCRTATGKTNYSVKHINVT